MLERFETTNQYLTAWLMMSGFQYQTVEYRQGSDSRSYSWFCFEPSTELNLHVDAYGRRAAVGNIQAFIDNLITVKNTLRKNREVGTP